MNRLTYKKDNGEFGLKGIEWDDVPTIFYGAVCKLKNYEDTGLSPEEVKDLKDENKRLKEGAKA